MVVRKTKYFCPGLALLLCLHLRIAESTPEQLATAELTRLEGRCLSHRMLINKEHAKIQRRLKSKVHQVAGEVLAIREGTAIRGGATTRTANAPHNSAGGIISQPGSGGR